MAVVGSGIRRAGGVVVLVAVVLASLLAFGPSAAEAADTDVVISEIHFHPTCDVSYSPCPDGDREFIEIFNNGDTAVDLSGWRFTDGVTFAFPANTAIGPFQRLVVASDAAGFQARFGFAPYVFDGKLSNSGEGIELSNALGEVIDTVDYVDGTETPGEWSVIADGDGLSLQLAFPAGDNGRSRYWIGANPTPGALNSGENVAPVPSIEDLTWTILPGANEGLTVNAEVYGSTNVVLQYRINYPGSTQSLTMSSADGVNYSATVPASAYSAGDLVRLRINLDGTTTAPKQEDTIGWFGTTVEDPAVDSNLPHLEWFTSTSNYNSGYSEQGDRLYAGVLAYDGIVYDNIGFRIRGAIARSAAWSKRNWKFKLPDHHDIQIDGFTYGVDTIDLQGGFADEARIREYVAHTIADEMGMVASQVQHVRLDLNGSFFGLHTFQEHPDAGFLKDNGLDGATLFKSANNPAYAGNGPPRSATTSVTNENWDIPNYINMLAAASVIQNNDFAHGNFYMWFDADQHGRYEGMVWDMDLTQGIRYAPTSGLTTRLENGNAWSYVWHRWKNQAPIMNHGLSGTYRQMYLRRLRTLADEWYGTGRLETLARDTFTNISDEWIADTQRWGFWGGQSYSQQGAIDRYADSWIDQYYAHILAGGPNGDIPGPQPANPNIQLTVEQAPADQRLEHIRLTNSESTAIDVSDWEITGSTNLTLAPGSVIPAGGSAYVVDNDSAAGFRAATANLHVLGEYNTSLPDAAGSIALAQANGAAVDQVAWGDAPSPSIILNEWNAVSGANLIEDADPFFGPVAGNGGDWFEMVVVEDNADLRGFSLEIADADNADGLQQVTDTFVLTDDPLFASVRAGTIITVAEDVADDVSYNPDGGDWTINLQANSTDDGGYLTSESQSNFDTNNADWQLRILAPDSSVVFGPAGEGANGVGGVGGSETGELEADPSASVDLAAYGDSKGSTFGAPNVIGDSTQDFTPLRGVEPPSDASIGDNVSFSDGAAAADVAIDLFAADAAGNRGAWLRSGASDGAGLYSFSVDAGCYVVVFVAPDGLSFVGGGEYAERALCLAAGETRNDIDAVLQAGGGGGQSIGDAVTYSNGDPAGGVAIDLFSADPAGVKGPWLTFTTTDAAGSYGFAVEPGCYVVVFIAPAGQSFVDGGQYSERFLCLAAGESDETIDAVLASGGGGGQSIGDAVTYLDGGPVSGVAIDLFAADAAGNRAGWLSSTSSDGSGLYSFDVDPDCYVVVFIAPDGEGFVGGGQYLERPLCVAVDEINNDIDAVVDAAQGASGQIGDLVSDGAGGVSGVSVDLYATNADGSRAAYLRTSITDGSGLYNFTVSPACYVVVFIAPGGRSFVGGGQYLEAALCVAADEVNNTIDAQLN